MGPGAEAGTTAECDAAVVRLMYARVVASRRAFALE